jgi:hypothetical protein
VGGCIRYACYVLRDIDLCILFIVSLGTINYDIIAIYFGYCGFYGVICSQNYCSGYEVAITYGSLRRCFIDAVAYGPVHSDRLCTASSPRCTEARRSDC